MKLYWPADTKVVLLHGLGSSADDFQRHFRVLGSVAHFHAINGIEADSLTGGRRWFPLTGNPDALARGIARAADVVEETIALYGKVALVGHSQGAMVCLELARRGRLEISSVWSFAGMLPSPLLRFSTCPMQTLQMHLNWSRADRFIDPFDATQTAAFFRSIPNIAVECRESLSLPHEFSKEWFHDTALTRSDHDY